MLSPAARRPFGLAAPAKAAAKKPARDAFDPAKARMRKRDLANLLGMLKMLLQNGLSLQRALEGLAADRGCRKHRPLLSHVKHRVSSGETLSRAFATLPRIFGPSLVQHFALAEASGTLVESLGRIVAHLEESIELRRKLIQKLSYPLLVVVAGSGLIAFMLTTVVPQFEKIYAESKVTLPWVTSVVTAASRTATAYLWVAPIVGVGLFLAYRAMRKRPSLSIAFDGYLLRLPLVGKFLTDISALEYLRSALVLSEAGFVPLDALTQAARSVPNRHMRATLDRVAVEIGQGQRISAAMRKAEHLFPSSVQQLILVAEHSGGLTQACHGSCEIVKKQLENRMAAALGAIEPILTISLAMCVGWIVLAIYMPMFHMFDVLDIQ